jgi:hypothetical protein
MTTDSARPPAPGDPLDAAQTRPTTRARADERPGSDPMTGEDTRPDGGSTTSPGPPQPAPARRVSPPPVEPVTIPPARIR